MGKTYLMIVLADSQFVNWMWVFAQYLGTLVMVGTAGSATAEKKKTDTTNWSVAAVAAAEACLTSATNFSSISKLKQLVQQRQPMKQAQLLQQQLQLAKQVAQVQRSATSTAAAPETPKLEATTPANKAGKPSFNNCRKRKYGRCQRSTSQLLIHLADETKRPPSYSSCPWGCQWSTIGEMMQKINFCSKLKSLAQQMLMLNLWLAKISWLDFGDVTGQELLQY